MRVGKRARAVVLPGGAAAVYLAIRSSVLDGLGANAGTTDLLASASNFGLLFFDSLRALLIPAPPYLRCLAESYMAVGAAIERQPDQAYGHAFAGMALINIGQPDEALSYLSKAVELQPNEPKYRVNLAQALTRAGRVDEAAELAESWLRNGRAEDAPLHLMVIIDAVESSDPRRAQAAARACVERYPKYGGCQQRLRRLQTQFDSKSPAPIDPGASVR